MTLSPAGTQTIIANLRASGQTSRADYLQMMADKIAELEAIEAAARAFVFADGRSNPPEKYAALKALLECEE